ncbi:MAG TPA: hypothetical protein VH373_19095 [Jatrophihabitantaceae bacterium]|jgi:hypothetical protein
MHRLVGVAIALALFGTVAACGRSHPRAAPSSSSVTSASTVAWARCMRAHGVDVPDSGSGAIQVQGGNGVTPQKIRTAMAACRSLRPSGGAGSSKLSMTDLVQLAHCMRQHGIDMPDPQPNGNGGFRIELPNNAQSDPRFAAAEQACGHGRALPLPGK